MEKPSTQEVSISTSAPTPTCLPLPALGETVRAALGPPGLHGEHRTLPQAGVKRWGEIPTHTHTHTHKATCAHPRKHTTVLFLQLDRTLGGIAGISPLK